MSDLAMSIAFFFVMILGVVAILAWVGVGAYWLCMNLQWVPA